VWNKRRAAAIAEMFSATGIAHGKTTDGGPAQGPEAFLPFHQAYLNAFPDLRVDVEDVIAEGRKVAMRWTATGTHRGNGLGFDATQKPMRMTGMTFVIVRNGMIVEGWDNYDSLSMLQQLGVMATPAGARTP
jgi:steroid delta-isomerase-like uncharacterized protein